MLRLPVKSLLKFRCVSKSWLSLISNPKFIKTHLEISTNNNIHHHNRLIFGSRYLSNTVAFTTWYLNSNEDSTTDTVPFDHRSNEPRDRLRIVGSCNGVLCVAVDPRYVVLWNPITRKSKRLPVSGSDSFDVHYGFGYDVVNDDYTVVESGWNITVVSDVYKSQVKVYSLRNNSWGDVEWPSSGGRIFGDSAVFVNGALHWKVYYGDNPRKNWGVMAQNVTSGVFESVTLPVRGFDSSRMVLGTCGNRLCAFYDWGSYMDVWVSKESWTILVCVSYFGVRLDGVVTPKPLFVSENGGILLNLGSDIVVHKPWPSRCHEVFRLSDEYTDVEATTFSESLISPDLDCVALR